jgi:hypothetical protein
MGKKLNFKNKIRKGQKMPALNRRFNFVELAGSVGASGATAQRDNETENKNKK